MGLIYMKQEIQVPLSIANQIKKYLSNVEHQGEESTITFTAEFPDGKLMDIKCCGQQDTSSPSWTRAVLFDKYGCRLACSQPHEEFFATWDLEYGGLHYIVKVSAHEVGTISNVAKLSDIVTAIANRIVAYGAANSLSGQCYFAWRNFSDLITFDDYIRYLNLIAAEIVCRDEIIDVQFDPKSEEGELDCNFGLDYCSAYEWCEGDEEVFGCSFEEWAARPAKPVAQLMSINAMAHIAVEKGLVSTTLKGEKQ